MSKLHGDKKQNQCLSILQHLQSGRTINPLQALNQYSCFRLAARIYDLKQSGYLIDKRMIKTENGKKLAQYSMRIG
ncbi:helix-turn-helix domain-containing protein [uncultured Gilliamella sp.]|uniref:helix-turn-helix domain-containing protein n=1 Tax=uncultured Gilliamella sp. TaxID=1193505 RepID=UPI0025D0A83F|nr:helix-turn-helix domain-containing protein [uncultured Gilliamella sp.]